MRKTVIIILVVFVAALAVSVGIQVVGNPDFSGFGDKISRNPEVSYVPGGDGQGQPEDDGGVYDWTKHPVYVVGDSLTEGAKKDIEKAIKGVVVDAKSGRTMTQGLRILKDWKDGGVLAKDAIIVVCLAHNITDSTLRDAERIVEMIEPGQSLIMMTGHGKSNMQPINEYILGLPNAYSYIAVADWDATISQSPALLSSDGVHIAKKQGNQLYAELILYALEVAKPMP